MKIIVFNKRKHQKFFYQNGTTIGEPKNATHEFQFNSNEVNPRPLTPVTCETIILLGKITQNNEKYDNIGHI